MIKNDVANTISLQNWIRILMIENDVANTITLLELTENKSGLIGELLFLGTYLVLSPFFFFQIIYRVCVRCVATLFF